MPREKLVRPNFLIGLGMSAGTDRAAAAHNHENRALADFTRMHHAIGLGDPSFQRIHSAGSPDRGKRDSIFAGRNSQSLLVDLGRILHDLGGNRVPRF